MVGLTVRSMVDGDGGHATASTSTCHDAYSSADALAPTEPAAPEAAVRSPDDEYTQPDESCAVGRRREVGQAQGRQRRQDTET